MPEKRASHRRLNRSPSFLAVQAERLELSPECVACGAPAQEAHSLGGLCCVDGPYSVEATESLCRLCHDATDCPRPLDTPVNRGTVWP